MRMHSICPIITIHHVPQRPRSRARSVLAVSCLICTIFVALNPHMMLNHMMASQISTEGGRFVADPNIHILLVGNNFKQQFPLLDYGGIEAHVEAMATGLVEIGANFTVITPRIAASAEHRYHFPIIQTACPPGTGSKRYIDEVRAIIERMARKPDLILSVSDWSGNHLHSLGVAQIVTHEDSGEPIRLQKLGDNVLHRFLSKNMRRRWTSAEHNRAWLPDASFALWPGFPPDEFVAPSSTYAREDRLLIFVGAIGERKGIRQFEELARRNGDWAFRVHGTGEYRPPPGVPNLEFRGVLRRGDDHRRAFSTASAFFMFVEWEEAFGRTVVEAMGKGTPVLGSDRGSIPELVPSFAGISSGRIEALDRALKDFNFTDNHRIYNWARKSFSSRGEMKELYLRGMELRQRAQRRAP